jgi:hypothetical protein
MNILCDNLKQRNSLITINDIILYTKAFQGDIFGEFIREWRILRNIDINCEIDIRLEFMHLRPFLNMISLKYEITDLTNIYSYLISNKSSFNFNPIKLNIHLIYKKLFLTSAGDFDCNLLAENDNSIYIRYFPYNFKFCIDKLTFIKERIFKRRFCLISNDTTNLVYIVKNIEKAIKLINLKWIMDDLILGDKSWIVSRWDDLLFRIQEIRIFYDIDKISLLKNCDECCLCQEKFKNEDIVINTVCNHNFHWICNNSESAGLFLWVKNQNKSTCPFCRMTIY